MTTTENPDSAIRQHGRIELPYGLTLKIIGDITDNPDVCRYQVGFSGAHTGGLVVTALIEGIQVAIKKKSANNKIQERAANYREWWLVVTDAFSNVGHLDQDSSKVVSEAIVRRELWKRIIAVAVRSNGVWQAVSL